MSSWVTLVIGIAIGAFIVWVYWICVELGKQQGEIRESLDVDSIPHQDLLPGHAPRPPSRPSHPSAPLPTRMDRREFTSEREYQKYLKEAVANLSEDLSPRGWYEKPSRTTSKLEQEHKRLRRQAEMRRAIRDTERREQEQRAIDQAPEPSRG